MTLTQITEKGIKDGEIINADISSSAAIQGTKISPNFGSQNISTTGTITTGTVVSSGDLLIRPAAGNNSIIMQSNNGSETLLKATVNGAVELYHGTSTSEKKFETTDSGVKVTDAILEIASSTCLIDLMETSTTNHRLRNGSGNFLIQRISDDKSTETTQFDIDGGTGAVSLYHNGTKKLETQSTGVEITGKLTFATEGLANGSIDLGIDADLNMYHDNSDAYFDNNKGDFYIRNDGNSTNEQIRIEAKGGQNGIIVSANGSVDLHHSGTKKFETTTNGISVTGRIDPATNDSYNLGTTSARWQNLYLANSVDLIDSAKVLCGNDDDLQIYHDGSHSYVLDNGTGELRLTSAVGGVRIMRGSGHTGILYNVGGQVELYYDNSKKFETTSNGAKISGTGVTFLEINSTDGSVNPMVRMTNGDRTWDAGLRGDANDSYVIRDDTASATRLVIDSSGNVGIATTDPTNADSADGGLQIRPNHSEGASQIAFKRANSGNTSTAVVFVNGNVGKGSITYNSSGTAYNTSSDYRLKENVTAISDGITRLKTLKPYRFNFKEDKDTTVDGFFAHEVTAVPEAITGTKDEVDSDNNPVYQGIDQSKLVPLLVAAVQELIGKVEALEAA